MVNNNRVWFVPQVSTMKSIRAAIARALLAELVAMTIAFCASVTDVTWAGQSWQIEGQSRQTAGLSWQRADRSYQAQRPARARTCQNCVQRATCVDSTVTVVAPPVESASSFSSSESSDAAVCSKAGLAAACSCKRGNVIK